MFKNEFLATSDPIYAWVFQGLWCLADREGRLEDRPRQIHLEINAGRAYETTEQALVWLADNDFILRYEHGSSRYIQIVKFSKHQNPHIREPASSIPAPDEHSAGTVPASDEHSSGPALSPFPFPPSPSPLPESSIQSATDSRELEKQIIAAYHEVLPELPKVKVWSQKRRSALIARIRERCKDGKPADTVGYWRALFSQVAQSPFLCGRSTDFRADLEWLIRPENFAKVIEGRYAPNGNGNGR